MVKLTSKVTSQHEDSIKDIYQKLMEVYSFSCILYGAVSNKNEVPELVNLENSIYMLMDYLKVIKNDLQSHIEFCENKGLFGELQSID